jgi:hypothetical protein
MKLTEVVIQALITLIARIDAANDNDAKLCTLFFVTACALLSHLCDHRTHVHLVHLSSHARARFYRVCERLIRVLLLDVFKRMRRVRAHDSNEVENDANNIYPKLLSVICSCFCQFSMHKSYTRMIAQYDDSSDDRVNVDACDSVDYSSDRVKFDVLNAGVLLSVLSDCINHADSLRSILPLLTTRATPTYSSLSSSSSSSSSSSFLYFLFSLSSDVFRAVLPLLLLFRIDLIFIIL